MAREIKVRGHTRNINGNPKRWIEHDRIIVKKKASNGNTNNNNLNTNRNINNLNLNIKTIKDIENKYPDVELWVYEYDDVINLSKIVVPKSQRGKGIGSRVMYDINKYADRKNKIVTLTPSKDFGGSIGRLKMFYKNFGFKNNTGRNKNYKFRDTMIRLPNGDNK